jgi:hypothetical protein
MEEMKYMLSALNKTLASVNDQIRAAGGKVTMSDMAFIEPLTHSIKSLETTVAMKGASHGESNRAYYDGGSNYGSNRESYYDGGAQRYVSPQYDDQESQRRRRDSMGRYM